MSQIIKNLASGPVPPAVATSYVTDNGTAIPAANVLNILGNDTTVNNDNGISTEANPNPSNNLIVLLTNRLTGTVTSTNGSVEALITFALSASIASYRFNFDVTGRNAAGDTVGYTVFATAKTNGAAATIVGTPFIDNDEDVVLGAADIDVVASGNSIILQVTGVAGQTIDYKSVGSYIVL